ncbi:MAG: hypothetical protein ACRYFS_15410 [Janthinobacterium lividum]
MTDPYYNTQASLIAQDIAVRYGDKYCGIAGFEERKWWTVQDSNL